MQCRPKEFQSPIGNIYTAMCFLCKLDDLRDYILIKGPI